jgi:putative flippase GtrA
MALSLHVLKIPEWAGLLMATVITMTWNFTTSKFLVFKAPTSNNQTTF